jgi:hypothetical protein
MNPVPSFEVGFSYVNTFFSAFELTENPDPATYVENYDISILIKREITYSFRQVRTSARKYRSSGGYRSLFRSL